MRKPAYEKWKKELLAEIEELLPAMVEHILNPKVKDVCYSQEVSVQPDELDKIMRHLVVPKLKQVLKEYDVIDVKLTVAQYAALANISPAAIYQRVHRHQIEYVKEDDSVLIPASSLNMKLLANRYFRPRRND